MVSFRVCTQLGQLIVLLWIHLNLLDAFSIPRPTAQNWKTHRLFAGSSSQQPLGPEIWVLDHPPQKGGDVRWLPSEKTDQTLIAPTLGWCQNFVAPLNLCPWAAASVSTRGAMQFYVVPSDVSERQFRTITESVAQRFVHYMHDNPDLPKVAIFFLLLTKVDNPSSWYKGFDTFYDWYVHSEDDWIDEGMAEDEDNSIYSLVTLAAFHPDWEFGGDGGDALDYEKKSPCPTLTMVWTETIDAAGPEATERIAQHNLQLLGGQMNLEQVEAAYNQAVWSKGDNAADLGANQTVWQ